VDPLLKNRYSTVLTVDLLSTRAFDGTAYCAGYNGDGPCGLGHGTDQYTPIVMPTCKPGLAVTAIGGGERWTLLLMSDGTVCSSGTNVNIGNKVSKNEFVAIPNFSRVTSISVGIQHALFLKVDGTVFGTGTSWFGQLGQGTMGDAAVAYMTPTLIPGSSGITSIWAGHRNSFLVKADGTVLAMGINDHGQLGLGFTTPYLSAVAYRAGARTAVVDPTMMPGISGVKAIAAHYSHTAIMMPV
jgi:alpha-tubulin suppressor-like RCC1 family protein